jgi:predicted dehydrogenase
MKLRIGVLGAGHLGKIHLSCLKQIPAFELVGFYDPNPTVAEEYAAASNLHAFESYEALLESVDVVDIVTPTLSHFDCAEKAFKKGKHVFIEKPITHTVAEAKKLMRLQTESGVLAQVGHVERFNPAYVAVEHALKNPMFIEAHRLAEFNPRGTDVSVVLDLMIHDLDIILHSVKSPIKQISASGVAVLSDTPDIANARIEFANGCVANLTASRISMKKMRKMRLFQKDAYITIDFLEKKGEVIRMQTVTGAPDPYAMIIDLPSGTQRQIMFETPEIQPSNAILQELDFFAQAINKERAIAVTLEDGAQALEVAHIISEKIEKGLSVIPPLA